MLTTTPARALLGLALTLALSLALLSPVTADMTVTFIDVGQGDAIWIHDDGGFDALIDGGERDQTEALLAALGDVDKLDLVMWTHGHSDHIGGLLGLFDALPVGQALSNGFAYPSETHAGLKAGISAARVPTVVAKRGDTYTWGESTVTVLHPNRRYLDPNDCSVVLRLSHGEIDLLLTGDAEWESERAMLQSGALIEAEVLKVGHHGSNTSTYSAFLDAVQPEAAIICVGADNDHGHPSKAVLQRLDDRGVDVYRTDVDGTVRVWSDGVRYTVKGESETSTVYFPVAVDLYDQNAPCSCAADTLNCGDFWSQADAQACYAYCWFWTIGHDVHRLDADGDGWACEGLP